MRRRKLSPRERQVHRLVLRQGMAVEDVAWLLRITVVAVMVAASKARKKLGLPGQEQGVLLPRCAMGRLEGRLRKAWKELGPPARVAADGGE